MRITPETHPDWTVLRNGDEMRDVLWVDTDSKQWCRGLVPLYLLGHLAYVGVEEVFSARSIKVDEAGRRILIEMPVVPPEIHNTCPIDADRAMHHMRVLCGESR